MSNTANTAPAPLQPQPTAAGTKRKRDELKFYAVRIGKTPGIYYSWTDCLEQVQGFPRATFKSFHNLTDAQAFLSEHQSAGALGSSGRATGGSGGRGDKWYAVQCGRRPGVYSTWPEVLEQITGWKNPKHKSFRTRAEADAFVAEGAGSPLGPLPTPNGQQQYTAEGNERDIEQANKKAKASKSKRPNGSGTPLGFIRDDPSSTSAALADPSHLEQGEWPPGDGPLPAGAEDNFDPTITLDHTLNAARYKTASELARTKYQATSPLPTAAIKIYTDGSALGNGQIGSMAGVGVYFGPRDRRNISEPLAGTKQTNQRAELTALQRALEVAPRDRRIIIFSDSNYAIKCVTEWFVNWRRNGWMNSQGKVVENKDLVVKVIDALEERRRLNRHLEANSNGGSGGEDQAPNGHGGEGSSSSAGNGKADVSQDDVVIWSMNGVPAASLGHWARGPAGVHFQWVKGHAKNEGNEAADELAVHAANLAKELNEDVVLD